MVFIGSRNELKKISSNFKNVWVSFIRKFNRTFRIGKPSKEDITLLIKQSEILTNEIMQVINSTKSNGKYKENLIALRKTLREINQEFQEFNQEIDSYETEIPKQNISLFLKLLKPKIKEIKALITLSANQKLNSSRRTFVKNIVAGTVLAPLSGCISSKFLIKIREGRTLIESKFYRIKDSISVISEGKNITYPLNLLSSEIIEIILIIIYNGNVREIKLTKEIIGKINSPFVVINGYLVSILVITTKKVKKIILNQEREGKKLKISNKEEFKKKHLELDRGDITSFIPASQFSSDLKNIREKNNMFLVGEPMGVMFRARPLTKEKNNILILNSGGKRYNLFIRQNVFRKIKEIDLFPDKLFDNLIILYLGNNPNRIYQIPQIENKLKMIVQGVYNVENLFSTNMINSVEIIDYEVSNATASPLGELTLYSRFLRFKNQQEIKTTTEYETLHIFAYKFNYTSNPTIRNLFANLKGHKKENKKRLIEKGYLPMGMFNQDYQNKEFFQFISEQNFINGADGGHPNSNVWEFVTSFIHSLIYIKEINQNLKEYNKNQQKDLFRKYKKVTTSLYSIAPKEHKPIFKKWLNYLASIEKKFN